MKSSYLSLREDSGKEWEVEKILKERIKRRKDRRTGRILNDKEYLVKWVGYTKPSWEPEENLEHCKELLKDFLLSRLYKNITTVKTKPISKSKNIQLSETTVYQNKKRKNPSQINHIKNIENFEQDQKQEQDTSAYSNSIKNKKYKKKGRGKSKRFNGKRKVNNNNINNINNNKTIGYEIEIREEDDNNININTEKEQEIEKENKIIEDIQTPYPLINDDQLNTDNKNIFIASTSLKKREELNNDNDIENRFKIISINGMTVPNNDNDGIILNIKFKKNNQVFVDNLNTKTEEIPCEYLTKYYEKFICELFKGTAYNKEMAFETNDI